MHALSKCLMLFTVGLFATSCAALDAGARVPTGAPTPVPEGEGWMDLLSDDHASQWRNVSDSAEGVFQIANGEMHIKGQKPTRYIAYEGDTFGDFELHIEFKLAPGCNSGVFFRTDPRNTVQGGMEIQVLDDHGSPPSTQGSGSLYDVATPMWNLARPAGEWNSYDITCRGSHLVVVANGWKVLDIDLAQLTMPIGKFNTPLAELPRVGHLILQDHGGEVTFRNLRIRKI